MPAHGAPTIDSLLEHVGFLRGLARSLVFDEGQAEDVVQEALVVALNKSPRNRSRMRAWLAGITRNLALKRLRTNGRRTRRERIAARPEALASTADVVSRLDLQRRIVEEVLKLEEPYRSTLVHRYFDDLSVREIAHRMGAPVKTVETRLRRAVQQLRVRMDGSHGGSRKAWVLGLAALVPAIASKEVCAAVATGSGSATLLGGAAMSTKLAAGVAAGLVATSFVVGWVARDDAPRRAPREHTAARERMPAVSLDAVLDELEAERAKRHALERELRLVRKGSPPAPPPASLSTGAGPRFLYEGFGDALEAVDWDTVARSLEKMPGLLADITDARLNDRDLPKHGSEFYRFNGPFVAEVSKLRENGIDGARLNNVWTHPAVVVNMIHAALKKAGRPLGGAQQQQLYDIGLRFIEQERRRVAGYADDALELERLIDEAALKDRFFEAVDDILDDEQRNVLHPAVQRGYTNSDLFSSAIVWTSHTRPLEVQDRPALVARTVEGLTRAFALDPSTATLLEPIVARRTAALPDKLLAEPFTRAAKNSHMRVERVREFAAFGVALRKEILAQLPLSPDQRAKVREDSLVAVPYTSVP